MIYIKQKGNRYYREDRFNFRSFPIKKTEVEKLITEGKAELVKYFAYELKEFMQDQERREQPEQLKNVFDITARLQAKKQKEETDNLIEKFKDEYLPFVNKSDLEIILNSSKNELPTNIVKMCMRIDLEKKLK